VGKSRIEARVVVRAPIDRVFQLITDHESMAEWPGISGCRLIAEGTPRNGLGAVLPRPSRRRALLPINANVNTALNAKAAPVLESQPHDVGQVTQEIACDTSRAPEGSNAGFERNCQRG
jgi:polyketide cyclase/dehydrase/lipid transport protein